MRSPGGGTAAPQTGLSLLMGSHSQQSNAKNPATALSTMAFNSSNHRSPSSTRLAEELKDRDQQASSLAAAGMVADRVASNTNSAKPLQGLQAPPPLATPGGVPTVAPSATTSTTATEMDGVNWNLLDLGAMHIDDMDMDFAQLFDPANEIANMQTEGSGWPSASKDPPPPS